MHTLHCDNPLTIYDVFRNTNKDTCPVYGTDLVSIERTMQLLGRIDCIRIKTRVIENTRKFPPSDSFIPNRGPTEHFKIEQFALSVF